MKNNKGFTLIELLAVIVIMGVLMMVAIPAVTKYINSSKKDAFADSAGAYINAARYSLLNDEYDCQAPAANNQEVYIKKDQIDIDKGTEQSAYGQTYDGSSYVKATYANGKIEYSICLVDKNGNGTAETNLTDGTNKTTIGLAKESNLGKNSILVKNNTKACSNFTTDTSKICKKK